MTDKRGLAGKRDIGVELLRVIGCLFVIGLHVKLSNTVNGMPDMNRILISSILADAVNIFWAILGFFLLTEKGSYGQRVGKAFKRVVLPLFLYNAFTFYFSDFIFNGHTIMESVKHPWEDYKYVFCEGILKWRDAFPYAGHLWFLYVYFAVILCSPALRGFAKVILKTTKSRAVALVVMYALLVINDITGNELLQLSYFSVGAVAAASFYVLLGGLIYHYREKISRSLKFGTLGLCIFFGTCAIRTLICYLWMSDDNILLWYSSFGIPSVVGICLIVFGFGGYIEWKKLGSNLMIHLGKISMYVYFFHAFAIYFYLDWNLLSRLENKFARSWYGDILYTVIAVALVAAFSLVMSEAVYWVHQLVCKFLKNLKK